MRLMVVVGVILGAIACNPAPPNTLLVGMIGSGYQWQVIHPGQDGLLGTDDDRISEQEIVVPAKTKITITLSSKDYIYELKIPHLGLSQMGVPDLSFPLEFESGDPGVYRYEGDQMCGFTHQTLKGTIHVLSSSDYRLWLSKSHALNQK